MRGCLRGPVARLAAAFAAAPRCAGTGLFPGDDMPLLRRIALFAVAATALVAPPAFAEQTLDFILNWVPGGDHAPYYYAKKKGWYKEAGIDLNLEPGKGSAVAVQKVGAGADPIGLADMANAL